MPIKVRFPVEHQCNPPPVYSVGRGTVYQCHTCKRYLRLNGFNSKYWERISDRKARKLIARNKKED